MPSAEKVREDAAPFPVDRLWWTDKDYEIHHRKMESLPCIRGNESFVAITAALHSIEQYHQGEASIWKESIQPFEPRQVFMRYDGKDWAYAFHRQKKYGSDQAESEESNVTGIAKKIVKGVSRLVRSSRKEIDAARPQDREYLEEELVQSVEHLFSGIYFKGDTGDHVKVRKLEGPRGPVYMTTSNGNHRVAAARLIGLKRIRGEVSEVSDPAIKNQIWFELLALLPEKYAQELQEVYNNIYPPLNQGSLVKEEAELKRAKASLPEIEYVLEERMAIQEAKHKEQQLAEEAIKTASKQRYDFVKEYYPTLKNIPNFKVLLHREALEYLWNHPSHYMQDQRFVKKIDDDGWVGDEGGPTAHIFGIDLDTYPLKTADEIKYKAIQTYKQTQNGPR